MAKSPREEELEKTILLMEEELERLSRPPYVTGTVLDFGNKTARVSVDRAGVYEVASSDGLKKKYKRGARVVLNPATKAVVDLSEFDCSTGEVVVADEVIGDKLKVTSKGEPRVIFSFLEGVKAGDEVLLDPSGVLAIQKLNTQKTKYSLEEVPDAPWSNIGGLEDTIDKIRAEVEEPFAHREVFARYGRQPAKGILLFGPPGCGKTLIAKSIAYNLSKINGNGKNGKGHFVSVKGPEILEKWVGNSEANIRRIYGAARRTAEETQSPVVVFIDEAESVFKSRGTGISTDVYDSIVPQFLAELDGFNGNGNVITVLATNREDILDSAVLRDGRVDRKIKVPRPSEEGAREIFGIYLKGKPIQAGFLPVRKEKKLADAVVEDIYSPENTVYNVISPRDGVLGQFSHRHMISGAMIKGMVDRACGYAIRREISGGKKGLSQEDLELAVREEFSENMGFAQALVRDDWESVFGARGRYYQDLCRQGYLVLEKTDGEIKSQEGKK